MASEPVAVPDRRDYHPSVGAWYCTGEQARLAADELTTLDRRRVAVDIETRGLGADAFTVKCVTFAWESARGTVSVLLDPRRADDATAARRVIGHATEIVGHNLAFDTPPLVHLGLMAPEDTAKITDTIVYARMAYPDTLVRKDLESLAAKVLGLQTSGVAIATAFTAAGYATQSAGFAGADIDMPVYRFGAMADTVIALRLVDPLRAACWDHLVTGHPYVGGAAGCDSDQAVALMEREQTVNRVMLRRSARGIAVDTEYLERFTLEHEATVGAAERVITEVGLEPGRGDLLVAYLDARGELPADHPRTAKTGKPSAAKDNLAALHHPLADAHRKVAEMRKVAGYLTEVSDMVAVTGRLHPQVGVLGASATGRMAYKSPPLQQFPANARPILVADEGREWTSIDWSSIEPVVMANCARDLGFLAPFEAGGDLYAPLVEAAGVERKTAKVVLLAAMYGQGRAKLAATLGTDVDAATRIQTDVFSAMPATKSFMDKIRGLGDAHGSILTAGGRVLTIPRDPQTRQFYGYKAVNYFCFTGDTPVLTADLQHVPASTIKVGDELVGFDEYSSDQRGRGTGKRFFRTAVVTETRTVVKTSVKVTVADGREVVCSADHKWLVRCPDKQPRYRWIDAQDLTPEHQLLSLGVWETSQTRDAGYLAGLYDGEGCLSTRPMGNSSTHLQFSQVPGAVMDEFRAAMDREGLPYTYRPRHETSTSPCDGAWTYSMARIMRVLGTLRPQRFIRRAKDLFDGAELGHASMFESTPHVVSVEPAGARRLVSITTSTSTLVANGYLSHNCQGTAYDVLADSIVAVEAAGLGDAVYLAMHDELVVDSEAAEDVRQIMERPPEWLCTWAGRTPVIRTDMNPMGRTWLAV